MIVAVALALQAAAAARAPARPTPPARIELLAQNCPADPLPAGEVVVCGAPDPTRLPLPQERAPVGPLPVAGAAALMVDPAPRPIGDAPCAALLRGCTVGFGPPLVPLLKGAAGLVKNAFAPRPDKSKRIPIPLESPPAVEH